MELGRPSCTFKKKHRRQGLLVNEVRMSSKGFWFFVQKSGFVIKTTIQNLYPDPGSVRLCKALRLCFYIHLHISSLHYCTISYQKERKKKGSPKQPSLLSKTMLPAFSKDQRPISSLRSVTIPCDCCSCSIFFTRSRAMASTDGR